MMPGMYYVELAPLICPKWTEGKMGSHRLRAEFFSAFLEQAVHFLDLRLETQSQFRAG